MEKQAKEQKKRGPKPKNHVKINDFSTENVKDDPRLPQKSLFRLDEVADYFGCSVSCIRVWIQHGHLRGEKIVGGMRVSRESILSCRFRKSA